jgi:hypothetical protein
MLDRTVQLLRVLEAVGPHGNGHRFHVLPLQIAVIEGELDPGGTDIDARVELTCAQA